MIYATVAGRNAQQLCGSMYGVLERICRVVRLENGVLCAPAGEAELMLWHSDGDVTVRAPGSVLVFGEPSHSAERIEVPDDCVVIAGMGDEAAAGYAARRGLRLLDCGLSSKASLTFSSIGQETGVISLQRSLDGLRGGRIEPLEIPMDFQPKPFYPLLAAVGVMLLAGMGERLEAGYASKMDKEFSKNNL